MKISIDEVKANHKVRIYIERADESLSALGYTEHSFAHVSLVAERAKEILLHMGYPEREAELLGVLGAELIAVEGRKLTFKIEAFDEKGPIGSCSHERFLVDAERFLNKTYEKL